MTMLQSYDNNLFSSIFPDRSEYASLIIKLLLVLETEKLIPLFELDNNVENNQLNSSICPSVINYKNQITSVKDVIVQFGKKINPLILFSGSNFQIELKENFTRDISRTLSFNSFLIFTKQGLILEYPELDDNLPYKSLYSYCQSGRNSLIFWEDWEKVSIEFAKDKPECTLIFTNNQGHHLKISQKSHSQSEVHQIEEQLPLVFCYFVMKNFWKYINKLRSYSFSIFNPDDFLYLDEDRLAYFKQQILSNISITEEDLGNLVKKIDCK